MRDEFYADKRDLVKWSVLLLIGKQHERIIQICYYNTSNFKNYLIDIDGKQCEIPDEVISHFRNINNASTITTQPKITVFDTEFPEKDRALYSAEITKLIAKYQSEKCVVFLDPDTGLEPRRNVGKTHVLADEVKTIWQAIPKKWLLVLYQHKTNRSSEEWIEPKREQFAAAIGESLGRVKTASAKGIANDVVFFYATK